MDGGGRGRTEITVRGDERRLRVVIASIVAPLLTVPTLIVLVIPFTYNNFHGLVDVARNALHASFFFALFGLPVAYAAEGLVIVATILSGSGPSTAAPRTIILSTSLAGAATMFLLWSAFFSAKDPWTVLLGAGMGFVSGLTFVLLRDGFAGIRALMPARNQEPSGSTSRAGA
jgi:hypothetical protein